MKRVNRVDSAFDRSLCVGSSPGSDQPSLQRFNTSSTVCRRPRKTASDPIPTLSHVMDAQRPCSQKTKPASGAKRPADPRRTSFASSSEHSTDKSRRPGYSKTSSRRTSYTIVDPSRPKSHYRIKSSQTVPNVHHDVDDVLALHFRSCSLFQNPSYHSDRLTPAMSGYGSQDTEVRPTPVCAPAAPPCSADELDTANQRKSPKYSVESAEATVMHWTSSTTRKREYQNIDRANSGLRGFIRKITPRCVSGPPTPQFYQSDKSDAGSVRRYRMDLSDNEDEEHDEKRTSLLRHQRRKLERPATATPTNPKSKKWACF